METITSPSNLSNFFESSLQPSSLVFSISFKKVLFWCFSSINCKKLLSVDEFLLNVNTYEETLPNGKKYIDKYKGYQKKTGQQSALLVAHGKIGGLNTVAIGYNFAFGGAAFSQRENEHFLSAAQFAMENNVELFLSVYQSGGMSVYGNINSLKSMSV